MIGASLILLCGLLFVWLARRQSSSLRHWVLAAALACAAAFPLLDGALETIGVALPTATNLHEAASVLIATPNLPVSVSPGPVEAAHVERSGIRVAMATWARAAWIAGVVVGLTLLGSGLLRLRHIGRAAVPIRDGSWVECAATIGGSSGHDRRIALLEGSHPALLATWGVIRPRIILPAGARHWEESRIRIVLTHELAHIQRRDWIVQLLAHVLRSVFWFNPLFWIAATQLRLQSEQACDDEVLGSGVDGAEYASHLLEIARAARHHGLGTPPGSPAPAIARPGSLERRVHAMLNTHLDRTIPSRSRRFVAAAGLAAVTLLVAAAGVSAQGRLSGSILDQLNGAVPAATVVLTNAQTGAAHQVKSDESGRFDFEDLPLGDYLLEVKLPGFATLKGRVAVTGPATQKDLVLELGTLEETIVARPSAALPAPVAIPNQARPGHAARPCTPSGSGGDIRPPMKIRDVRPVYSQAASDAGLSGRVVIEARIGTDGLVASTSVREAAHPELADAATIAIQQWEFTPTLLNCTPVEVDMVATVTFAAR